MDILITKTYGCYKRLLRFQFWLRMGLALLMEHRKPINWRKQTMHSSQLECLRPNCCTWNPLHLLEITGSNISSTSLATTSWSPLGSTWTVS